MRLLVLDNYDSFTYNLVHYLKELGVGKQMKVVRNDKINLEEVAAFDAILLSPGPGVPKDAGIMPELLKHYGTMKKILGVCLGHQAIAETYGAKIYNMETVLHGVSGTIKIEKQDRLFEGLPKEYGICHYHSWTIDENQLGSELEITAKDELGHVMAIRHKTFDVRGVQFHPESIMTEYGHELLKNWIKS